MCLEDARVLNLRVIFPQFLRRFEVLNRRFVITGLIQGQRQIIMRLCRPLVCLEGLLEMLFGDIPVPLVVCAMPSLIASSALDPGAAGRAGAVLFMSAPADVP